MGVGLRPMGKSIDTPPNPNDARAVFLPDHGKNQSHVAWMAGGGGLYIFMSDSPHNWQHIHRLPEN